MISETKILRAAALCVLAVSAVAQLAICILIFGPQSGFALVMSFPWQILAAYGAMFGYCWWAVPRWGSRCMHNSFLAGIFAISVFALGALVGTTSSLLVYWQFAPAEYILLPVASLLVFGGVPAFIIGIGGAWVARLLTARLV